MKHDPTAATADDERRLSEALDASRPMPQGEIEELVNDLRRIVAENAGGAE